MYRMILDEATYRYADTKYIYYPGDSEFSVSDFSVNLSVEECSTIQFTIYPDHPYYNDFILRKSMISFYRDDKPLFYGQVREVSTGMDRAKTIYAVSELAFLLDTYQVPQYYSGQNFEWIVGEMLLKHNAIAGADKQFNLGDVSGPGLDYQGLQEISTNYDLTLDVFRNQMSQYTQRTNRGPRSFQQYINVHHVPDVAFAPRYLDIFNFHAGSNVPDFINQPIRLKLNLMEFESAADSQDFITAVVPLGAELSTEAAPGVKNRVTIKSVNDEKLYIQNDMNVADFGFICEVVEFDGITSPSQLKLEGQKYLYTKSAFNRKIELTAFDLSLINVDYDQFEIGKRVWVYEPYQETAEDEFHTQEYIADEAAYGTKSAFGIVAMNIVPLNPDQSTMTLVG